MAQDTAQERTEEATPRRRHEARRKGTVTRSVDLTSSIAALALLLVLPYGVSQIGGSMVNGIHQSFGQIPGTLDPGAMRTYVWGLLTPALLGLAPIVGAALVAGVLANVAQVGFVLSAESLNPTLSKINPMAGFKRLFSMTAGVEGLKACIKSVLFGWLAFAAIREHWTTLASLSSLPPLAALAVVGGLLYSVFIKVAVAWLVLAALDYWFQKKQVDKQLRMTKEELKQEMKDMEQSPELRGAMARRRHRLMKGRLQSAMKTADAVVTNPEHYAVAIQYDPKKMHAPMVVAKGMDYLAQRIRELAAENKVPIVPNPPLARQLYKKCEVGDYVPRELFQAVAEVLAYVYTTLKRIRPPV